MKHFQFYVTTMFKPFALAMVAFLAIAFILTYRLGGLNPGFSKAEIEQRNFTSKSVNIIDKPSFAPHAVKQLILQKLKKTSPLAQRSVSTVFALISAVSFFLLVRLWHTQRIALMATVMYATSSWFLHYARVSTPQILFTLIPLLLLLWVKLRSHNKRELSFLVAAIVCALFLYIPGMVWFVVLGIIWQAKQISKEVLTIKSWYIVLCIFIGMLIIGPLLYASYKDINFLKFIFGLPKELPAIKDFGRNIIDVFLSLPYKYAAEPGLWLGKLPLLDVFSAAMLAIGMFAYWFRFKLDRTILIFGGFLLGIILVSLGGPVSNAMLLPFVYLFIAAGLTLMLQQWFTIFPRNPIARTVGVSILSAAVLVSCSYNIVNYYIAWAHAPETKQTYNQVP